MQKHRVREKFARIALQKTCKLSNKPKVTVKLCKNCLRQMFEKNVLIQIYNTLSINLVEN